MGGGSETTCSDLVPGVTLVSIPTRDLDQTWRDGPAVGGTAHGGEGGAVQGDGTVRSNEIQVPTREDIPPSGLCTAESHGATSVIKLPVDRLDLSDGLWVEVHTDYKTHPRLLAE